MGVADPSDGWPGNTGEPRGTRPDALVDVDFSAYKNSPIPAISEAFRVQFRAEFFNVLNHASFAPPINHIAVLQNGGPPSNVADAGLIDRTTTNVAADSVRAEGYLVRVPAKTGYESGI